MRRVEAFGLVGVAIALASTPALAAERGVRGAHDAIVNGDYPRAERLLIAEQRIFPAKPEIALNLAAVYARTGRASDAARLYRQVLTRDDVLMDLNGGRTASSHAIAQAGLARLDITTTAAR